jgi:hypothetical protein
MTHIATGGLPGSGLRQDWSDWAWIAMAARDALLVLVGQPRVRLANGVLGVPVVMRLAGETSARADPRTCLPVVDRRPVIS